jgi:predicted nucleotidyltransferase
MFPHHAETIRRTTDFFSRDASVRGLLLGGSIAHGFQTAQSDVDVMILVANDDHRERMRTGRTTFFSRELCTYAEGYVDGKYTSEAFLQEVRAKGSEPARFAFQDAKILIAQDAGLADLLRDIARYPTAEMSARMWRFQAQFEAWNWYTGEALKRQNLPLLRTAVAKLTLFGGRIVLAHNQLLYPYHKWFLRVLESAPEKPESLLAEIDNLAKAPTGENIEQFGRTIREFRPWEISHATWPAQFMQDSEVNWLTNPPPVDDL